MVNNLKFLLIIVTLSLIACSSGTDYDSTSSISKYNNKNSNIFKDDKYQGIYSNIYLRLALEKSLNNEALDLFLSDMTVVANDRLLEQLSGIAKDEYRYDDIIKISKYWKKINNTSYKALSYGFSASVELEKYDMANEFYNNFITLTYPKSDRDFARILFELQSNKNRESVVNYINKLVSQDDSRELKIAFIDLLYTFNMPHEVLQNLKEIKLYNERHLVRLYANSNLLIGNTQIARDALENFLKNKKITDRQVQLELVEIYLIMNDLTRAEELIKKLISLTPDDSELIYEISRLLYQSKYYDNSEKYLSKLVINHSRIDFLRGMLDLKKGNYSEAISHFDRVDDYSFKYPALFGKSDSISKKDGYLKAISFLDGLTDFSSEQEMLRVLMKKIEILRLNNKYLEIIDLTSNYLDTHNRDVNVIYARAMAYESLGKIENMEIDLKEILEVDFLNTNTLNALGYSLTIHTNRYKEALGMIEKAYSHDPGNSAIIDSLGWVNYKIGNLTDALKFIKIAYEKDKDPEIIEHYCEILLKMGLHEEYNNVIIELEKNDNSNNKELIEKLRRMKSEISI